MSSDISLDGELTPENCRRSGPAMTETGWGYVIRDCSQAPRTGPAAIFGEHVFGAVLLIAAVAMLLLPSDLNGHYIMSMKIAAMVLFAVIGGALIWHAGRRKFLELQVDTAQRVLRLGERKGPLEFRQCAMLTFGEVASVYLVRARRFGQVSQLYLRMIEGQDALEIARGPIRQLEPIHVRLSEDLKPPRRKIPGRPPRGAEPAVIEVPAL